MLFAFSALAEVNSFSDFRASASQAQTHFDIRDCELELETWLICALIQAAYPISYNTARNKMRAFAP